MKPVESVSAKRFQWSYWTCSLLALWILASPFSMGYANTALRLSDIASGLALLAFCVVALTLGVRWRTDRIRWALAAVGLWLTVAPLVFWARDAASYANGALVGTLVIVCSVIVPSVLLDQGREGEVPPGWTYNPSSWRQRTPIIGLAFMGFLMARYLSAFQLGHIRTIWEPFFGRGTEIILTSEVSRWFPVSDAGLGAWSYLLDALSGALGGVRRWRSMPWVVVLFGIMIIPPGVTSITLVILQPVAVGAWCTLCLATAGVMLAMVPPAIDEVIATVQALRAARRQGHSLWRSFWFGVPALKLAQIPVHEELERGKTRPWHLISWHLAASAILGLWLMVSPAVLKTQNAASDASHLLGALIVTFAVIAMAQVARPARFFNCLLAIGLAVGNWFLSGGSSWFRYNATAVAALLFLLSLPIGPVRDRFGAYGQWIRWMPFRKRSNDKYNEQRAA